MLPYERPSVPDVYIIAEKGAEWGACVEEIRARGCSAYALIQSPFEPFVAFVARVRARLEGGPRARGEVCAATTVLAFGSEATSEAIAARKEVIRATREAIGGRPLRVVTCASSALHLERDLEGCVVEVRDLRHPCARATRVAARKRILDVARGERRVA